MWSQISGGEVIRTYSHPTTLTIDGVTYPRQVFMDKSRLASLGILPYRENSVDQRYHNTGNISYTIGEEEVVGTYTKTDKDITVLKENMIEHARGKASSILARDDWMSIREVEGGTAIPDDIKTYRAEIRTESGTKEDEINALSDLDAIKGYEATSYTYVYKLQNEDGTYGPDTETRTQHINLVTHYEASDPLATADPSFVSLTKD